MKKFLAVAGMLAVMAGAASAQGGGGMGGGRMRMSPEAADSMMLARLFEGITLSAEQTTRARAVIHAAREEMASMDRQAPDFREKMMEHNNKRNADLKALLTSDADKAKFDENAARGRGGRRGGGR